MFPDTEKLMKMRGKRYHKTLKRVMVNLEIAYSSIWENLFNHPKVYPHHIYVAEGDVMDALKLIRDYLDEIGYPEGKTPRLKKPAKKAKGKV